MARREPARLEHVLARYDGDFGASEVLGDWHLEIRAQLRQEYLDGLSVLADLHIEASQHAAASTVLERLVRADDLREDGHRRLMLCCARTSQRDRALRQFERLAKVLAKELAAEPERANVQLAQRIRRADPV